MLIQAAAVGLPYHNEPMIKRILVVLKDTQPRTEPSI